MCLPYLKDKAESFSDNIVRNTPNGLILLNEKQAAAFLGLTDRTLQQRRYYSQPPAYIKLPGSNAVRYRLSDLIAFVEAGEVPLE